jgi:hypothetical protein
MMHVVLELLCASIHVYGKLRILLDKEDSLGYIRGVLGVGCTCLNAWTDIAPRGRKMSKNRDTKGSKI